MTQIILDAAPRSKLHGLTQPLELCDESGIVLARVIPVSPLDATQYEAVEVPLGKEELERRRQETEEYTTAEVLAHLKKL